MPRWPRSLTGGSAAARLLRLWVRIPARHGFLSLVSAVYYQVEISAKDRSLIQKSPTEYGVCECDLEISVKSTPTRAVKPWKQNKKIHLNTAILPSIGPRFLYIYRELCSHPTTQRPTTATNHIQQNQSNTPNAVTGPLFSWRWV